MRRCHQCNSRFLQIGGSLLAMKDARRMARKMALALTMAGAFGILLMVILWLSRAHSAAAPALFLPA